MATWTDMARENRTSACELMESRRWRNAISRAYFAVYAETTARLHRMRVTMPAGRSNPSHKRLSEIVGYQLSRLDPLHRWRLAGMIGQLYRLRIIADYRPDVDVAADEARIAMGLMVQAWRILEIEHGSINPQ